MQRHESFLEQIHRHLSLPGTSVHRVARAIDELLAAFGECVPTRVVRSAVEIRIALERDGIVGARLRLEALRRPDLVARTPSGVFEGLYPEQPAPGVAGVYYRTLSFEIADAGSMQLLSLDGATPVRIGQPRHVAFLHHVHRHRRATLDDAIRASGTDASRAEQVYYEARGWIGPQWLHLSANGSATRLLSLVIPAGCTLYEQHVMTLTEAPPARRRR